jgi:hypothetical protein
MFMMLLVRLRLCGFGIMGGCWGRFSIEKRVRMQVDFVLGILRKLVNLWD